MGSIRPSNIKRIAESLVEKNASLFNNDFYHNRDIIKKAEKDLTKKTLNALSGYVTRYVIKKESRLKKEMEDYSATPEENN
ncbi:MAG: 30S ribosomal protein S17e [Candidatus Thermoplasmatota archaeon]|nr:30S ribosomal protein S17e [Candidatus Thermoplasmatota archaeon]